MTGSQVSWQELLDLVAQLDESGIADAEILTGDVHVRISRSALPVSGTAPESVAPFSGAAGESAPARDSADVVPARTGGDVATAAEVPAGQDDSLVDVTAPMLGTVYLRPSPDAAPFVAVGDQVSADSTVAVIEVMKLMNNVAAGVSGRIVEITAVEGTMVEYAAVLFRVDPT